MLKKLLYILAAILLLLLIVYLCGPKVSFDKIVDSPPTKWATMPLEKLDQAIADKEATIKDLKPDNQARIVWQDSTKSRTGIAVCYLHGFSASQEEGDPVHQTIADTLGANMFLSRLYDHGRSDINSFQNMTPQQLIDSANEAIDIASRLGDTLLVVSCSTGGTLSAYLASKRDDIDALVMYSPNIDLYDKRSELLLMPWGEQIAKVVYGGDYSDHDYTPKQAQYWNKLYHIDATFMMRNMLDQTMTDEVFKKIDIPVFLGYYYEDEEHSDHVVSVQAMRDFYQTISTPKSQKMEVAFITPRKHVLSSYLFSQDVGVVIDSTVSFIDKVIR